MKGRAITYSQAELDFIKAHRKVPRRELTEMVNAEFGTSYIVDNIKSLCTRKGWKTGRTGYFQKGQTPHPNARPKGPNKTSFKKGQKPVNHRPVGSERVSKDGYVEIKVSEPRKWALKHRYVWEQSNGPVPKDKIVIFQDGDKRNFDLENLRLISRSDNAILNKYGLRNVASEVKPSAITYGQLVNKTRQMGRAR